MRYYFLANAMITGNIFANLLGWKIVTTLSEIMLPVYTSSLVPNLRSIGRLVTIVSFIAIPVAMLLYELPVRRALKDLLSGKNPGGNRLLKARKRLLNEPFFVVAIDLLTWSMSALLISAAMYSSDGAAHLVPGAVLRNLVTGLLTVTIAFFYLEHVFQHRLAPVFFPEGGLYSTPGTLRIKMGTRIAALILAGSIVPLAAIHITIHGSRRALLRGIFEPLQLLEKLQSVLLVETLIFMLASIGLAFFVTVNITRPLREIIRVLREVSRGVFNKRVPVSSNDEIGYTGDVINEMTRGLRERDMIKEAFGKYVSKEIRDEVLSGRIPLDGEMKEVTIIFADLRDFTPMTEHNDPKVVVRIVNSYFNEMTSAIQEHGGLVLQFLGDEIYAVFGAPVSRPDHPVKAFSAGLEMNRRLLQLNKSFEARGLQPLRHGIGIHTGRALAANLGSPDRLSYLLVGDTVNLASRLQSLTKELGAQIIISADTHAQLPEQQLAKLDMRALPPTTIKGMEKPVRIFALGR